MRSLRVLALVPLLVVLIAGCGQDTIVTPNAEPIPAAPEVSMVDVDALARGIVDAAGWPLAPGQDHEADALKRTSSAVRLVEEETIAGDVNHSVFELDLGPGAYRTIRLHRLVTDDRDRPFFDPREAIFMVHGGGVGFEGSFLASPSAPEDRSLPVYLAQNGVDVWGIDFAWTLVPLEESDLSFMAEWGLQREVDDLAAGVAVARLARLLTGSGVSRMNVLGWSLGVPKILVYASQQAKRPRFLQDVKTIVTVDGWLFEPNDPCSNVASLEALIGAGQYADTTGQLALFASQLAAADPNGPSPIPDFAGLTNLQVVLFAQTLTQQVLDGVDGTFHLFAGLFDDFGLPTGLHYVDSAEGVDFYGQWVPWSPNRVLLEFNQIGCNTTDPGLDVEFSRMDLPVLYVAPNGGYGEGPASGIEAVVSSRDFRTLFVTDGRDPILDIGHVDLFKAEISRELFWRPVLEWVEEFARRGGPRIRERATSFGD